MSKRHVLLLFIFSITYSVNSMQKFGEGPGHLSDDEIQLNFCEEICGFDKGQLVTKVLDPVDSNLGEQVIRSQKDIVGKWVNKLRNFENITTLATSVLLVGSSGCGKSTFARYVPQKYGWKSYFLKSSLVSTEFKSSGSQNLAAIFNPILQATSPTFLIIDEVDAITRRLAKANDSDSDMVPLLWMYLDDCEKNKNVVFLALTNDYDELPNPLKTRCDQGLFRFKDPSFSERKDIIKFHLGKHNGVSFPALSVLAFCWKGKSAREIKGYINEAISDKESELLDAGQELDNFVVTFGDIQKNDLKMKWTRYEKLKKVVVEHPAVPHFVAASCFSLGMYYLQHNHAVSFRLEDAIMRRRDAAFNALGSLNPALIILESLRKDSEMGVMVKETLRLDDPEVVKNIKDLSLKGLTAYLIGSIPVPTFPNPNLQLLPGAIEVGCILYSWYRKDPIYEV